MYINPSACSLIWLTILNLKEYMEHNIMEHNIKDSIKEVLEKGYLMSLATIDDGGVWVADVIYVFDDELNVYWMSDPDARHSKALITSSNVAGTISVSGQGEDNLGIQFGGIAQKIDSTRYDLAKKHYAKRKKPQPQENDDVLRGDSWYILKPKKIELIYEKLFGFNKQQLLL